MKRWMVVAVGIIVVLAVGGITYLLANQRDLISIENKSRNWGMEFNQAEGRAALLVKAKYYNIFQKRGFYQKVALENGKRRQVITTIKTLTLETTDEVQPLGIFVEDINEQDSPVIAAYGVTVEGQHARIKLYMKTRSNDILNKLVVRAIMENSQTVKNNFREAYEMEFNAITKMTPENYFLTLL